MGVCVGEKKLPLRPDARLEPPAEPSVDRCDPARRRMYWCHVPRTEGVWLPGVHTDCVHNEEAALLMRTMGPTPPFPDHPLYKREFRSLQRLAKKLSVDRWTRKRVVESYSGKLRRRYAEADTLIETDGLDLVKETKLKAFLKAEKFNPLKKASKPRMIMPRDPKYNLELSTFLKPLEHALWRRIKGVCRGVRPTRQVGKGLNPRARAELIACKMGNVGSGCVVFEVDGKSFESHITVDDLDLEHSVYLAAFGRDRHLQRLLSYQLELKGRTANGIKFRRLGARASGDPNTGLGNTLIMLAACRAAMAFLIDESQTRIRYDLLADGDNCLIFVQDTKAGYVWSNFARAASTVSSQELAVENPVSRLEHVVFGQSKPVLSSEGFYTMVRDPWKVLSGAFSGHKHYHDMTFGSKVLRAVSQGELALARGVPVLQAYFQQAVFLTRYVPELPHPEDVLEGRVLELLRSSGRTLRETLSSVSTVPVTDASRRSFADAFGISIEMQHALEENLVRNLDLPVPQTSWRRIFPKTHVWRAVEGYDYPLGFDSVEQHFEAAA